ncbi:Uncharacterized protein CTA2_12032 [Colletotrichum tanaceti]|uniref:Uncharacterized protein n=1 Tax=Colletotrichum tanaceti TaxID=1306861 RepID=A0A4U6XEE7_9PEZI|nr:Uncharacterized protein CTA2_12032 [Colletotrichum tanaceti]TKW53854.1 Uncharacterized protein CTA1_6019 [Colletotrichum tanaceti]
MYKALNSSQKASLNCNYSETSTHSTIAQQPLSVIPKMTETINPDYLVIGAGAMGMAFVDTLLADTQKTVAIVDRYDHPGGHWTIGYPFVRLHQPAALYGVNSKHLGQGNIDKVGWNKGLLELSSRDEICAYYDKVLHQTFLPSGRVTYYPKHEYTGGREFRSIFTGKPFQVGEKTRIVDATCVKVTVPAMLKPAYEVAHDVLLVTPNDLPKAQRPHANYTVVGAGKTGIDVCLWLLAHDVDPDRITWVVPRDSFFLNRDYLQPGPQFADKARGVVVASAAAIQAASSVDDLLERFVACGHLLRLDENVWPTMYHCATISSAELEQLRRIKNVVRKGRILRVGRDEVLLQHGKYAPHPDTLYVNCSVNGLPKLPGTPVFQHDKISLQSVRHCQPVFSAAFIAHVEATYADDLTKNKLCRPIENPEESADVALTYLQSFLNGLYWMSHPEITSWLPQSRLDLVQVMLPPPPEDQGAAQAMLEGFKSNMEAAVAKLRLLLKDSPQGEAAAKFEALYVS